MSICLNRGEILISIICPYVGICVGNNVGNNVGNL